MIKVVHSSKYIDYIFNFTATENNLSWSLMAEGDGVLFLNPLTNGLSTNVASFTIDGAAPTFPVSLTNGSSKSVTIVKTTNGQTASLTLRQRRAIDKSVNIYVPDFGAYTGRYLYVLKDNGIIEKHDTSLFTPSNYAGSGIWTSTTLVSTITLPTLPNTAKYSTITFVKNGGVEKMLIQGCEINVYKSYASFIRLSDDTVWNLNFTTQNTYTQIVNFNSIYNALPLKVAIYDYIGELVTFVTTYGANGFKSFQLDLGSLVCTPLTGGVEYPFANYGTQFYNYHRSSAFIPTINKYSCGYAVFDINANTYCYLPALSDSRNAIYNKNINCIIVNDNSTINKWTERTIQGKSIVTLQTNSGTLTGQRPILGYNSVKNEYISIATAVTNNNYSIFKKNSLTGAGYITQSPASGSTYGYCLMKSYYNDNWYITGNLSLGLRRITVINSDNVTPDFGYLDVDANIYDMATNQIFD